MNNEKDTIDKLFSKKINHLNKSEKQKFEKYNIKIQELNNKLKDIIDEDKRVQILEKIEFYNNKIKKKISKKKNFLLENYDDLFNYFTVKQDIDKNNNPKKMIHNFFNKKKNDELINDNEYANSIENYIKRNNFELYSNQYLNKGEEEIQICNKCNKGELICSNHDGILICNQCYLIYLHIVYSL